MTEPDLRDLLHDHVADVSTTDLTSGAWARGRTTRRRRSAAALLAAGTATAAVLVGVVAVTHDPPTTEPQVVAPSPSAPSEPVTSPAGPTSPPTYAGPRPYDDGRGKRPDATYGDAPVFFSPTPDQEASLSPADDAPVPATIDLRDPAPSVADRPIDRAEAAFVVTAADGARSVVLVAPDGTHRSLDLGPAGDFTPSPFLLSPIGDVLLFPRAGSLAAYDLGSSTWHQVDTGGRSTEQLDWQGDDVLLYSGRGTGPAVVCYVLEDRCGGHSNPFVRPAIGSYGGAQPYGRVRGGITGSSSGQAGKGGDLPAPAGTPRGGSFLDAGGDLGLLVQAGVRTQGCCALQTWLPGGRVVYQAGESGELLVAWTVGTHDFELVSTVVGVPDGATWLLSTERWDLGRRS